MSAASDPPLFLRCPYCAALFPVAPNSDGARHDDNPPLFCRAPLPGACFACGAAVGCAAFSATQRARVASGEPGFCAACVAARARARYEPPPPPPLPGALLHDAVGAGDVARVRELLAGGADANAARQASAPVRGVWRGLFFSDGAPAPEADPDDEQPTTPLKLAGFRIADGSLGEDQLADFESIARELLRFGADARPALRFMERRYGAFDARAEGCAQGVFAVVHAAAAGAGHH